MRCPYCADENSKVIDSRLARDGAEIRRRRECVECTRRFTTRERVDDVMPKVAKRDERREDFQREKILSAIQKACQKRPVSADAIEKLVDRVERYVQELGDKEIPSRLVGERVMQELAETDELGAARFASVFHDFQNADDYARFFESIRNGSRAAGPLE